MAFKRRRRLSSFLADAVALPAPLDFPRISFEMIGARDYAEVGGLGPALRANLILGDYCNFGLYGNGPWDNGDGTYLSRQAFYDTILAGNSQIYMTEYTDVMESDRDGTNHADKLYAESGPVGADSFWQSQTGERPPIGVAVNDWWARNGDGTQKSTFGSGNIINTNITDYTQVDGTGRRFPQYYADYQLTELLYTTTPKDGTRGSVGVYGDVMDHRVKS